MNFAHLQIKEGVSLTFTGGTIFTAEKDFNINTPVLSAVMMIHRLDSVRPSAQFI
jgi:hypothetical protein